MPLITIKRFYPFVTIVKLLAVFLVYQYVFVIVGQLVAFISFRQLVEPVSYSVFTASPTAAMTAYAVEGVAVGMFLSSLATIAHLLIFGYVRIRKGFLKEVGRGVLALCTLFIFCMMVVFNIVAVWLGLENSMQQDIELLLKSGAGIVSMAILAPILEELLFRGAIQGMLMRYFKNPWVGILLASLSFGIIHINPIQVFYATCLGVGFGWVYYRTGSLLPAIVGHILNNSLAVVNGLIWGMDGDLDVPAGTGGELSSVLFFSVAVIVITCFINRWQPAVPVPWRETGDVNNQ